jgi:hypothetical protein
VDRRLGATSEGSIYVTVYQEDYGRPQYNFSPEQVDPDSIV